jgi:hypothetical protein
MRSSHECMRVRRIMHHGARRVCQSKARCPARRPFRGEARRAWPAAAPGRASGNVWAGACRISRRCLVRLWANPLPRNGDHRGHPQGVPLPARRGDPRSGPAGVVLGVCGQTPYPAMGIIAGTRKGCPCPHGGATRVRGPQALSWASVGKPPTPQWGSSRAPARGAPARTAGRPAFGARRRCLGRLWANPTPQWGSSWAPARGAPAGLPARRGDPRSGARRRRQRRPPTSTRSIALIWLRSGDAMRLHARLMCDRIDVLNDASSSSQDGVCSTKPTY